MMQLMANMKLRAEQNGLGLARAQRSLDQGLGKLRA